MLPALGCEVPCPDSSNDLWQHHSSHNACWVPALICTHAALPAALGLQVCWDRRWPHITDDRSLWWLKHFLNYIFIYKYSWTLKELCISALVYTWKTPMICKVTDSDAVWQACISCLKNSVRLWDITVRKKSVWRSQNTMRIKLQQQCDWKMEKTEECGCG